MLCLLKSGRVPTVDEEFDCRQEAHNKEDRFAVAVYGDTQSSIHARTVRPWTPSSSIFTRILHVREARRYNHGRENGNSPRLASTRTKLFGITKFRAV